MDSNVLCHQVAGDLALNRRLLKEIEGQMSSFPAGSLCRKTIKGKHYYYQYLYQPTEREEGRRAEKQQYLSARETPLRSALTQKAYCRAAANLIDINIQAAKKFLATYRPYDPSDIWASLPPVYRDGPKMPLTATKGKEKDLIVRNWLSEELKAHPPYPDHLVYRSPRGLPVRSKAESLIAAMLENRRIPFRYEAPLSIEEKLFFPDFTVMRRSDHCVFYWEHLGLMDDAAYRQHAYEKLHCYAEAGILPFQNLITTYESPLQPFDAARIDRIIRSFLV